MKREALAATLALGLSASPAEAGTFEDDMAILEEVQGGVNDPAYVISGPAMSPPTVEGAHFELRLVANDIFDGSVSRVNVVNMRVERDGTLALVEDVRVIRDDVAGEIFRTSFRMWESPNHEFEEISAGEMNTINRDSQAFDCPRHQMGRSPEPLKPLGNYVVLGAERAGNNNGLDLISFDADVEDALIPICEHGQEWLAGNHFRWHDDVNTEEHVYGGPGGGLGLQDEMSMVANEFECDENGVCGHAYVARKVLWLETGRTPETGEVYTDVYDINVDGNYVNRRRAPFNPQPVSLEDYHHGADDPATFASDDLPEFEHVECVAVKQGRFYPPPLKYACHVVLRDTDRDGVPDLDDNCITTANPIPEGALTQIDTDTDLLGDECDPCPRGDFDEWTCGPFQECRLIPETTTGIQNRICELSFDCPAVTDPAPDFQNCTPRTCVDNDFVCTPNGECDAQTMMQQWSCEPLTGRNCLVDRTPTERPCVPRVCDTNDFDCESTGACDAATSQEPIHCELLQNANCIVETEPPSRRRCTPRYCDPAIDFACEPVGECDPTFFTQPQTCELKPDSNCVIDHLPRATVECAPRECTMDDMACEGDGFCSAETRKEAMICRVKPNSLCQMPDVPWGEKDCEPRVCTETDMTCQTASACDRADRTQSMSCVPKVDANCVMPNQVIQRACEPAPKSGGCACDQSGEADSGSIDPLLLAPLLLLRRRRRGSG